MTYSLKGDNGKVANIVACNEANMTVVVWRHCISMKSVERKWLYLVDRASNYTLISKIKPCMCKFILLMVKPRMAHYISCGSIDDKIDLDNCGKPRANTWHEVPTHEGMHLLDQNQLCRRVSLVCLLWVNFADRIA